MQQETERAGAKPKRIIASFEPEPDVQRMLERARFATITHRGEKKRVPQQTLSEICNEALRRWLKSEGYARKKDLAA